MLIPSFQIGSGSFSNKFNHTEEQGTKEGLMHTEIVNRDMSEIDAPLSPSHPLESSQESTCCHMWVTDSVNKFSDGSVSSILKAVLPVAWWKDINIRERQGSIILLKLPGSDDENADKEQVLNQYLTVF